MTLEFAECLGVCDAAPAILVNETLHGDMTKEKIDELVEEVNRRALRNRKRFHLIPNP